MFTQLEGTLMDMSESPDARFVYTIWFDYTRESINAIQEGTMLAVPNFGADEKVNRMSVLEVTSVKPSHFRIARGYRRIPRLCSGSGAQHGARLGVPRKRVHRGNHENRGGRHPYRIGDR